jgi:cellulose synthase/poly-beta-1,6-N-acetylglucosamine synthase-like glycosyltransferase
MPNAPLVAIVGPASVDDATLIRSRATQDRPLVSVVVSTRNHASLLERTVEAVMGQDLDAEVEMIVVDDASTDDTPTVMRAAVERARRQLSYARMSINRGPAVGRNFGLGLARGEFIAFTDSDCTPSPGWLRMALAAFSAPAIGIVQGRTEAGSKSPPLFSHFMETREFDGRFSTCNVVYRRKALGEHRFDPARTYNDKGQPESRFFSEDVDLGWRVLADGWTARFAPKALIEHEVIALTPIKWILWPGRYGLIPATVARYPAFRRHLFLRVWVSPLHLWFDVAVLGVVVAAWKPITIVLAIPYVIAFAQNRSLRGKFPPAKLVAYLAWDAVALYSLLVASIRNRRLVL